MKPNYIVIPTLAVVVSLLGRYFVSLGLRDWYPTLTLPSWTPPGFVIGMVWTLIYVLTAASAIIFWNRFPRDANFKVCTSVFFLNAILNVGWSYAFFTRHAIHTAVWISAALEVTVLALIVMLWPRSRLAASLLIPYAAWVVFATYLNYVISTLNP
jgi:tryptophan-rich sensory protein